MLRVFEEYGAIVAQRPWTIYLIDLSDIFSPDLGLRKLWQECGQTPWREKGLHLNGYQAHRPRQEKPQPHLQLQRSFQIGLSQEERVFLVHDETRSVYIWGKCELEGDVHRIFVQHDKTGQRLPPAEDFRGVSSQTSYLIDHAMSPNGRHLVLFYNIGSVYSSEDLEPCGRTVVWQINEHIGFERRMNHESWARVFLSHDSKSTQLHHSSRAVMFEDDYHCITPSGRINLLTGSRQTFPDDVLHAITLTAGFFCSCNGRDLFVFALEPSENCLNRARRIDLFESSQSIDFCWTDRTRPLVDVSPTGQYLVLGEAETELTVKLEEEVLYLYDTKSNETIELRLPQPLNYHMGEFLFSRDETRLTAFLDGRFTGLTVIVWDCLGSTPRVTSHAALHTEELIVHGQIHVNKTATSAVIVTRTRSIQRIEIGDTISLRDASKIVDDYPRTLSVISRDGSHWALVSYGRNGGKVQIIDLISPNAPACHFDLEWSQGDIPEALDRGTYFPVGISPDLGVLIIEAEVFDLTATNDKGTSEKLTLTSFTMKGAQALLKPHRHRIKYWCLDCRISPCNSFVVYVGHGAHWGMTSYYSSDILLYHIDLQKRTSARLEHTLPEGLYSPNASFHPLLPLVAFSYGSPSTTKPKPNPFQEELPPLRVTIFDLRDSVVTNLDLPKGNFSKAMAK